MRQTKVAVRTPKKPRGRPFVKGQPSANPAGRPKGSRNKLNEEFLKALVEDFEQYGAAAIRKARKSKPAQYVQIIASLLPKDVHVVEKTHEEWLSELGE